MKQRGRTPPFRGPHGEPVPGSIAETNRLRLGGLDQWVMIRGESIANPLLILLHGGPGLSETPLFRRFNAPLEKDFTVVYWDQRGAGKSFDRRIPRSSMTVEQFIADLDELVDSVRARVGQDKVAIFGHSWGSALGVLYAARFPGKVSAYVGSGQIGDAAAAESASYAFALAEAERLGNGRARKALRAIGPPPYGPRSLWTERTWLQRLEGQFGARAWWEMGRIFLGGPESSLYDLPGIVRGFRFSLDALWAEASTLNLLEAAPALQMPIFFFLGRSDRWVPPETSVAYFDALKAPSKTLVWFEASGHEPFADEPARFNAEMVERVRPGLTNGWHFQGDAIRSRHSEMRRRLGEIESLIAPFGAGAADVAGARNVLQFFKRELGPHMEDEERLLYPDVDRVVGGREPCTSALRREHRIIRRLIVHLEAASRRREDLRSFARRAENLIGMLYAHMETEEAVILPLVDFGHVRDGEGSVKHRDRPAGRAEVGASP
jgi:pimeloyl-ACP methyl ester carboxylesterase/hemerythrin-like domain-containing protein